MCGERVLTWFRLFKVSQLSCQWPPSRNCHIRGDEWIVHNSRDLPNKNDGPSSDCSLAYQ